MEVVVGTGEIVSADQFLNEATTKINITNSVLFVENESVADEFRVKTKNMIWPVITRKRFQFPGDTNSI